MLELVAAVAAAVLISAMCSLFEAVLYAVPIGHIESLASGGRKAGRILRRMREDVDRPIAAILSLNTIANTAGAAVAGAAALKVFGDAWLAYFSAAFTLAILMFSEVIPKTAGVVYSRPLATVIAQPLAALVWLFRPLIWLCSLATRVISRGHQPDVSGEEIRGMARMGQQSGAIEADHAAAIENILTLPSKSVRDIMTPRTVMFALSAGTTVAELRKRTGTLDYSRVPVFDKDADDIVGIVLRRDVLTGMAEGPGDVKLEALMRPVEFVAESVSLDRLLRIFMERRQHLLIVLTEFGGLAGLVSLEDVIEEILGQEIVDEFDKVADLRQLAHKRRQQTLKLIR